MHRGCLKRQLLFFVYYPYKLLSCKEIFIYDQLYFSLQRERERERERERRFS